MLLSPPGRNESPLSVTATLVKMRKNLFVLLCFYLTFYETFIYQMYACVRVCTCFFFSSLERPPPPPQSSTLLSALVLDFFLPQQNAPDYAPCYQSHPGARLLSVCGGDSWVGA